MAIPASETAEAPGLATILAAIVDMLGEVGIDLEETAGKVTEFSLVHGVGNKDFVVALQAFDRMRQELEALAGVLRCCMPEAGGPTGDTERAGLWRAVRAGIPIAALREQLERKVGGGLPASAAEEMEATF